MKCVEARRLAVGRGQTIVGNVWVMWRSGPWGKMDILHANNETIADFADEGTGRGMPYSTRCGIGPNNKIKDLKQPLWKFKDEFEPRAIGEGKNGYSTYINFYNKIETVGILHIVYIP